MPLKSVMDRRVIGFLSGYMEQTVRVTCLLFDVLVLCAGNDNNGL